MNILIVDDSVVYRSTLSSVLSELSFVKNIKVANNGEMALDIMKQSNFDLITLDLEMPIMDGIETIKKIRAINKEIIIIVFSSLTTQHAKKTIEALSLGANDFVTKVQNVNNIEEGITYIKDELIPLIEAFYEKKYQTKENNLKSTKLPSSPAHVLTTFEKPKLIFIASSTGGPDALKKLFSKLSPNIDTPILIVQHMPPIFTAQLANFLTANSKLQVKEAVHGEILKSNKCYLAPGGFHMVLENKDGQKSLILNQDPLVCHVRPAANVTLNSLNNKISGNILAIVLTGMGEDGMEGIKGLKANNNKISVIIQDKESSVVWGMPGSVHQANLHDSILSLEEIANTINKFYS